MFHIRLINASGKEILCTSASSIDSALATIRIDLEKFDPTPGAKIEITYEEDNDEDGSC